MSLFNTALTGLTNLTTIATDFVQCVAAPLPSPRRPHDARARTHSLRRLSTQDRD